MGNFLTDWHQRNKIFDFRVPLFETFFLNMNGTFTFFTTFKNIISMF